MIDLPTIVEAIRRQRPGVVPEWLCAHSFSISPTLPREEAYGIMAEFFGAPPQDGAKWIPKEAAQSIIEAALWRALRRKQSTQSTSRRRGYESCGVWIGPTNGRWYAKTGRLHAKAVDFGDDELALVRALCHAIGIEVASA